MGKKIYVGNLPYSVDDSTLQQEFGKFGSVTSAKVVTDPQSGRSKGFGFVEMESDEAAAAAIEKMNGVAFGGRNLNVSEARPKEAGGGGFRGGRGGGFRGGDRGDRGGRGGFGGQHQDQD